MSTAKMSLQLAVSSLPLTEAFYGGILELPIQRGIAPPNAPEYCTLQSGEWELVFVQEEAMINAHPQLEWRFENFPKGIGLALRFTVSNLDDIYEAILEEDLEILCPLDLKPYGMKDLWCFDPDGYLVLLEEPTR